MKRRKNFLVAFPLLGVFVLLAVKPGAHKANAAPQAPAPRVGAAGGSYHGPDSEWVHRLLDRAGEWSCPSSPSSTDAKPPQIVKGDCVRDQYVNAAMMQAWAAECYAQSERDNEAQQHAAEMMKNLRAAEDLCSNAPNADSEKCPTERIYKCGELK